MSPKTTVENISNEQIIALADEAHHARDWDLYDRCNEAIVFASRPALQACADALNNARAAEPTT